MGYPVASTTSSSAYHASTSAAASAPWLPECAGPCDNAYKIAQETGMVLELCAINSPFLLAYDGCNSCVERTEKRAVGSPLLQYRGWCSIIYSSGTLNTNYGSAIPTTPTGLRPCASSDGVKDIASPGCTLPGFTTTVLVPSVVTRTSGPGRETTISLYDRCTAKITAGFSRTGSIEGNGSGMSSSTSCTAGGTAVVSSKTAEVEPSATGPSASQLPTPSPDTRPTAGPERTAVIAGIVCGTAAIMVGMAVAFFFLRRRRRRRQRQQELAEKEDIDPYCIVGGELPARDAELPDCGPGCRHEMEGN